MKTVEQLERVISRFKARYGEEDPFVKSIQCELEELRIKSNKSDESLQMGTHTADEKVSGLA